MLTHQKSQPQMPKWRVKASSFTTFLSFYSLLFFFYSLHLLFVSLLPTQILKSIRYAFDWYTVCTAITACTGRVCTIHPHLHLPPQSSHAIPILSVILLLFLPLRMHARTAAAAAAVASCSRHGWEDESRCELLRERWRAWGIWRRVKDSFRKWRRIWHNKWSNRCTFKCFYFEY